VKIEKGRRVRMKVHLAVAGGDTLEKSVVEYIQGAGTMLAGLEQVLEGLEKGAKRDGTLKSKDAFGNPAMHPIKKIKRAEFP
jgi:FKBP-type peptidyl-prolyl cis-trans isomerase 2